MRRNSASPRASKMSAMVMFSAASISASSIEEAPAQAMGEMAADGGFAGPHEADQVDAGRALEPEVHAVPLMAAMRAFHDGGEQPHRRGQGASRSAASPRCGRRAPRRGEWRRRTARGDGEAARALDVFGGLAGAARSSGIRSSRSRGRRAWCGRRRACSSMRRPSVSAPSAYFDAL